MEISQEQFERLVTKEDLNELRIIMFEIKKDLKKILKKLVVINKAL